MQKLINNISSHVLNIVAFLMGLEPIEVLARTVDNQDELNRLAVILIDPQYPIIYKA